LADRQQQCGNQQSVFHGIPSFCPARLPPFSKGRDQKDLF